MKDKQVIDMEPFLNMCFKQMDEATEILLGSDGF